MCSSARFRLFTARSHGRPDHPRCLADRGLGHRRRVAARRRVHTARRDAARITTVRYAGLDGSLGHPAGLPRGVLTGSGLRDDAWLVIPRRRGDTGSSSSWFNTRDRSTTRSWATDTSSNTRSGGSATGTAVGTSAGQACCSVRTRGADIGRQPAVVTGRGQRCAGPPALSPGVVIKNQERTFAWLTAFRPCGSGGTDWDRSV